MKSNLNDCAQHASEAAELDEEQVRTFFHRSFVQNEPINQVHKDMKLAPDFEIRLFRSLRKPVTA